MVITLSSLTFWLWKKAKNTSLLGFPETLSTIRRTRPSAQGCVCKVASFQIVLLLRRSLPGAKTQASDPRVQAGHFREILAFLYGWVYFQGLVAGLRITEGRDQALYLLSENCADQGYLVSRTRQLTWTQARGLVPSSAPPLWAPPHEGTAVHTRRGTPRVLSDPRTDSPEKSKNFIISASAAKDTYKLGERERATHPSMDAG